MGTIMNAALPLLGIALIVLAVILRQHLSGRKVLDLNAEKLGLVLKVDAFGLVVVVGSLLGLTPIYLLYQGYEDRISKYEEKVKHLEGLDSKISDLVTQFKDYELRLNLTFARDDYPDLQKMEWPPIAYVHRSGEREPKRYEFVKFERGPGGPVATFTKLRFGDLLFVEVGDRGKRWRSSEMSAPGAQLQLTRWEGK